MKILPYSSEDETAILSLFHQSFGKPLSAEFWKWRFLDNPAGTPMIDLAWDERILAGHYAVSPVIMDIEGQSLMTALSMTTMTHPQYRGQGLFTKLASSLYSRLQQSDYFMVWGFPNDQSHRGFVRDLEWQDVTEIPMLKWEAKNSASLSPVSAGISEYAEVTDIFDRLWEEVRQRYRIVVRRDAKYLRWRLFQNPQNRYKVLGYSNQGRLLGYAAYKEFQSELDLVDLLAVDLGVSRDLLIAVQHCCVQRSLLAVNVWVPLREREHHEFEKRGFRNSGLSTYLAGRVLSRHALDIADVRLWHHSMLDSDVF